MSAGSWIADALLGSPIPPPNWLDPRYGSRGWKAPDGYLPTLPRIVLPGYRVPGREVRAELDEVNSCVNQPVIQGWAWLLAVGCVGAVIAGLASMGRAQAGAMPILLTFGPAPAWIACVLIGGFCSNDVELRNGSIYVRRWFDVWFGRAGRLVGSRASTHAALSCGNHLQLEGDNDAVTVSMEMWPSSSRRLLEKRLETWGIELEFPDRHHAHHPQHWNHGRHRVGHGVQGGATGGLPDAADRDG